MTVLTDKIREVLYAVLPITVIVLLIHFTISPLEHTVLFRFVLGAVLVILGLSIFLFGVEVGIGPIGNLMGETIAKSGKIGVITIAGLFLGFFISIAEPDLHILAGQVELVSANAISQISIVIVVSIGIAVMMTVGLLRMVYNIPLHKILTGAYLIIFALGIFTSSEFLAVSFDASGATTGAMTVPFMLALALGVAHLKKDSRASEKDSFGLVAITSSGAIIAVMIMGIINKVDSISGRIEYRSEASQSVFGPFVEALPEVAAEIVLALLPIVILFILCQAFLFKMPKKSFTRIIKGLVQTFIGLVLFLVGVNAGFMEVGSTIGFQVASLDNKVYIVVIGFILGLVTVLAEPAVHVLTQQIEDVTSGSVNRRLVLGSLSLSVGIAVALSMIRILVYGLKLWHYLLPGYLISLILAYIVPKLFVGIAFDSGGVASGPMTATFILAFAYGAADAIEGADVLSDGFGMIALVAMAPLISLQILGLIYKIRSKKRGLEHDGNIS